MSREHAYAYEAGYRDGSINYELEHCPACKNVADLQEALAENAKLRDERREYQATIDSLVDECADHKAENDRLWEYIAHKRLLQDFARLVDENSKLRKLVRDMWEGYNDPRCEECHLKDTPTCADCPICAREASVIDRMRELGVEVDA